MLHCGLFNSRLSWSMLINRLVQRIGNKNTIGTIITTILVFGFRAHLEVDSLMPGCNTCIVVPTHSPKQTSLSAPRQPSQSRKRFPLHSANDSKQASRRRQPPARRGKITSQELDKSDSCSLEAQKSASEPQSRYT